MISTKQFLYFRAALYGQTDIAGYKPAAGDLAYPEKLEMMKSIEMEKQKEESDVAENRETGLLLLDMVNFRAVVFQFLTWRDGLG